MLMEKEKEFNEQQNMPLTVYHVKRALRMMNKTMSDRLIEEWIKKCEPFLECKKPERKDLDQRLMPNTAKSKSNELRIFPHEFLFLICNAQNRMEVVI